MQHTYCKYASAPQPTSLHLISLGPRPAKIDSGVFIDVINEVCLRQTDKPAQIPLSLYIYIYHTMHTCIHKHILPPTHLVRNCCSSFFSVCAARACMKYKAKLQTGNGKSPSHVRVVVRVLSVLLLFRDDVLMQWRPRDLRGRAGR